MLRSFSSEWMKCLILFRARDVTTKFSQSRLGLCPGGRDDLDDVAVAQAGAERHHLAVHPRADALVADVGVDGVGEVHRRRVARERLHLALRREDVDLFGVELDLEVLEEFLRIADLLLPFEELPQPDEVLLVAAGADPALLVLPVRRNPVLRGPVHVRRADLHLEGHAALADDRRVERLVAVRPRHGDEVLDAARHRRPRLMDDAERAVAVLHRLRHDAQRDHVVDLIELDLLLLELLVDAEQPLDPAVDLDHRHLRLGELGRDVLLELVDHALGRAAPPLDADPERLVRGRLEVLERQLLQLVLDLAHAEPVGNRRVDVARLLRDLDPPLLREMVERAHVVQPVGELDEDDADVVHHGEQHLAEVLRLPLLARRERDGPQLGDPFDDVGDVGAEELLDAPDRGLRVLDDVVQEPGRNRHDVELHVRELVGHLERVDQIRLPGVTDLALVLEGRKDVRPPQQVNIGVRVDPPDFFDEILEPDHEVRCLTNCGEAGPEAPVDAAFFGSLY